MDEILRNPKSQRGFSADEIDQMRQIVRGTPGANLARKIGKLAPSGVVSGALALDIGSTLFTGVPLGASIPAIAGSVAKKIGETATQRGIDALSEMTRNRSPLAKQAVPRTPLPVPPSRAGAILPYAGLRPHLPALQSPQPAYGGDNQDEIPRPPEQHKRGGRVKEQRDLGHGVNLARRGSVFTVVPDEIFGGAQ
jgi:hypothetical protein